MSALSVRFCPSLLVYQVLLIYTYKQVKNQGGSGKRDFQSPVDPGLKPNVIINYTESSSFICKTISIFNEHSFQYNSLYAKFTDIKS